MKENPFDKKLADAVRQTFDDYTEDPSAADMEKFGASLNQLHQGQAGSSFWLRAAAGFALLLAVLGILFYVFSDTARDTDGLASLEDSPAYESPVDQPALPLEIPQSETESLSDIADQTVDDVRESQIAENVGEISNEPESVSNAASESSAEHIHEIPASPRTLAGGIQNLTASDVAAVEDTSQIADIVFLPSSVNGSQVSALERHPSDYLSPGYDGVTGMESVTRRDTQPSRASLSLGTSAVYTSDGLAGGVGLSAGALREWSVAPRFSIVAGGLLNYNQFRLRNEDVSEQIAGIFLSSGTVDESLEFETQYSQLALEVPVQAFYEVYKGRRTGIFSVGAGLASRLYMFESEKSEGVRYVGEVFSGTGNGESGTRLETSQFSASTQTGPFRQLDTARLLYLSFVYETQTLNRPFSVELFTKHPLGDLTSSEIQFGTTGLTFRYGIW